MNMGDHLLSWILFTPLLGMVAVLAVPSSNKYLVRWVANLAALASFLVSLQLVLRFDTHAAGFQFVERASWIPSLGVNYSIGVDGISYLLVILTTALTLLSVLASWSEVEERLPAYYAMLLLLETGILGVFLSLDFFLFYVFWEAVLVPMYFLIGIWGGERRLYAALKFFLYTMTGSVLMLIGILILYFAHANQFGVRTFEIADLMRVQLPIAAERTVFWLLFLGFAVKVPMFPFHTWLPDAHTEAPTAGSVMLAGALLKMGTYGFLRISLPLLPNASQDWGIVCILAVLSLIAILYGALVSLMQKDWKKLVAYSSVSHMGFITLGIFSLNTKGLNGAVIQQISHGISTGLLFLLVGIIYERRHTRVIAEFGGVAHRMPNYAAVFAIAMLSSAGLPLLNGFVGEFTILQGAFEVNPWWAALAVPGIVLGAAYLLWLYQRTMLGELTNEKNRQLLDLNLREWAVVLPLVAAAFWIGIYPKPLFEIVEKPVAQIMDRLHRTELHRTEGKP